jgi:hypothetical protein
MITLAIIILISFFAFVFFTGVHSRQKSLYSFISVCLSVTILIISFSAFLFAKEVVINDADSVCTIILEENCINTFSDKLYYDSETKKYFIIELHYFNPFTPLSRHYVETENAEAYIEVYNKLAEIELN